MLFRSGARLAPDSFALDTQHRAAHAEGSAPLIDDLSPSLRSFEWRPMLRIIAIGVALGALVLILLNLLFGWRHPLVQMGWFFAKAALLSFGGAYAVLPYVYQGAVDQFGWLSAPQMIDGLALGETTPGPLIMIVAFVGRSEEHTLNSSHEWISRMPSSA